MSIIFTICTVLLFTFRESFGEFEGLNKIKLPLTELTDVRALNTIIGGKKSALLCFLNSQTEAGRILDIFQKTIPHLDDDESLHMVDCSQEGKKLCSDLQLTPDPYVLQHYLNGSFHRVYEGKESPDIIARFMKNPTEELPWEDVLSEVAHLEENTFTRTLRQKRHALVMFYAPWCGHCRSAKPEYQAAAEQLKGDRKFLFAAVDCTKNAQLCHIQSVKGYPTTKYYNYFNMHLSEEYTGHRRTSDFVDFLMAMDQEIGRTRKGKT